MFQLAEFIKRTDDAVETAWRTRDWGAFIKLWLMTSIALTVCSCALICLGGAILIEGNRVYQYFKVSGNDTTGLAVSFNALLLYAGLWNFASAFAAVTAAVALVSGPFTMIAKSGSFEKK
jgi:hypothetical protein